MWNDIMKKSESFMISVPVKEHMFRIKEHNIAMIKEDVEFMVLYTILVENERLYLFTFLEPQLVAAILGRIPDDRARDLAKRLGEIIPGQLLMAALNDGKEMRHWMFLLIDLSKEIVYFFDPLRGYIPEVCKNVVGIAFQLHNLTKGKKMKQDSLQWYNVKCPQQQDFKTCSFYVCAMMRDLVFEPQPSSYIKSKCNNQQFYSKD
ncbi:hypothetical protein F8388_026823 [Cannabis sativa]|uniref:Ubiquitin-like protease family profile domain-containing protein n=1 Tax=Cannabis sativa TaxID=3483 RepID=A0A7J6H1K3_CANSA|nr:hypothetical protein F8388_026823 [Cannabis sativa]